MNDTNPMPRRESLDHVIRFRTYIALGVGVIVGVWVNVGVAVTVAVDVIVLVGEAVGCGVVVMLAVSAARCTRVMSM